MSKKSLFTPLRGVILLIVVLAIALSIVGVHNTRTKASGVQQLVGPKQNYLALGDSLAFGYQPNNDFTHGYDANLFAYLQKQGTTDKAFLGCPGETSQTFTSGVCPAAPAGTPSQLSQAIGYLKAHPGQVSPVTLQIGANDVLQDIDPATCKVNVDKFQTDLATLDTNLTQTILPQISAALKGDNGESTGDIIVPNYYDSFQNVCPPEQIAYLQTLNQHLADDVSGYGTTVDLFSAFGGANTPNANIDNLTWINTKKDIHPTTEGYTFITQAIIRTLAKDAVSPVFECVSKHDDGSYSASFGYNNTNVYAAEIPVGGDNHFFPDPQQRNQPEFFLAGRQGAAFQADFAGGNLVWALSGHTSTAGSGSHGCSK